MSALNCPVCSKLFEKPMILSCGHSICNGCIIGLKKDKNKNISCPLCYVISNESQLRINVSVIQFVDERKKIFAQSKGLGIAGNMSVYVDPEHNNQVDSVYNNPLSRHTLNYGPNTFAGNRLNNFQPQRLVAHHPIKENSLRLVPPPPPPPPSSVELIPPKNSFSINKHPPSPSNDIPLPINRAAKKAISFNDSSVTRATLSSRVNNNLKPYDIDNFEERFNFNNNLPKPPKFKSIVV